MTEDEAKTKWCPFARVSLHDGEAIGNHAANRFPVNTGGEMYSRCIGSECMAWRWKYVLPDESTELGMNAHKTDSDGNWLGYCGLAGKP